MRARNGAYLGSYEPSEPGHCECCEMDARSCTCNGIECAVCGHCDRHCECDPDICRIADLMELTSIDGMTPSDARENAECIVAALKRRNYDEAKTIIAEIKARG